jgi:hypothetical protein
MKIAILSTVFVFAAGILGRLFEPTEEQLRPLTPEPSTGDSHDDHGHGGHH